MPSIFFFSSPENLRIWVIRIDTRSTVPTSPSTRTMSPTWTRPSESRNTPASRSRMMYWAPKPSTRPRTPALASTGVMLMCTAPSIRMSAAKMIA